MRKNMFTICKLLIKAYHASVTPGNIIGGFQRSELWRFLSRSIDPNSIRSTDMTSSLISSATLENLSSIHQYWIIADTSSDPSGRITTFKTLCDRFLSHVREVCSDGVRDKSDKINVLITTNGAMNSDNVLAALQKCEEHQKQQNVQRVADQAKRQKRAVSLEIHRRNREHQRQERDSAREAREEAEV